MLSKNGDIIRNGGLLRKNKIKRVTTSRDVAKLQSSVSIVKEVAFVSDELPSKGRLESSEESLK